ncbi:HMG box-containing protein 1-like [Macrosteles quadrilineatus]|uniref:HMG box-containing protein 1-like n=1 Tax=Macrosteles quadrilineatus TaxID=74068 RepID=UPI0023E0D81B|nr:HMG box-containing protein 1-like [Macrosteles quadrilineatus]
MAESYLSCSEDQPRDLTVKTAKKMKPIPPPLNLSAEEREKMPLSMLKEFAIIATSPKSPLMQKHLPFRKRAHSIPVNLAKADAEVTIIPPIAEENTVSTSESTVPSSPSIKYCAEQTTSVVSPAVSGLRSHLEPISHDLTDSFVLDLSTNGSVLLSPAPSSLGSSREELADSRLVHRFGSWKCPWPSPVWHCFQSGVRVKVGGCWRLVEQMPSFPNDWSGELLVERVTPSPTPQVVCCSLSSYGEVIAEVTPCHPFLVKDRGWVAVCPDSFQKRYGLKCLPLQPGDVILHPLLPSSLPLPLPSPDICERIKRFSFPTMEEPQPQSPAFLLSPPTTPTRKTQESDKPKRPMNAFMLFAKRYRLELIQTNPGKDNRAISVILGEAWRMLPQEERDKYIQGARDLSEEQKLLYPDCWKRKRSHSTS